MKHKLMIINFRENALKATFCLVLFVTLLLQVLLAEAQNNGRSGHTSYRGLVASFGTKSALLSSDIAKIDQTNPMQAGGQVGLIFGTGVVRSKLGLLGYYSSTGNTPGTVDLYQSNAIMNFYPLSLMSGRSFLVEPYFLAGVDYDRYRFHGYYIDSDPGNVNYSQVEAPYVGKMVQVNATVGAGVEVKLWEGPSFIHLFSEVRQGRNLLTKSSTSFSDTQLLKQMQVVIGISFGTRR